MSNVYRLFVEKKQGFDLEASHLAADLSENLGIKGITSLRLANRYDIEGLSREDLEAAAAVVFSEPNQDTLYYETWDVPESFKSFATEYLPGQYDQRADSAAACVQLLTAGNRPNVQNARVIAIEGNISHEDILSIQKYLINPVDQRLASMDKPDSLEETLSIPDDISLVSGFTKMNRDEISDYHKNTGFAMTADDLEFCRDYFISEQRDPTVTELKVIDTYWSDHCRHTTFLTRLDNITIEQSELSGAIEGALKAYLEARAEVYGERKKDINLMDMATMGMRLLKKRGQIPDLDVSEEINACSVEVTANIDGKAEAWLVQFKNETHNHPTEIEPFGGAATCLGGAIRDPLSGRSYVYHAMRVTGSSDPTIAYEDTLEGKLPPRKITTGAAAGYSSYGNQIGLATGQVTELYDEGYVAKRMEIGAVIGASPKENVVRDIPKEGDIVILLGGRTGRDGCGGATGSSKAHTAESIETCGAEVQKGNPLTERKIQRLFRNPEVSKKIIRCNDFGAGGVCVAIGELSRGLTIDLNNVPKKYNGLDGTELAISESQERMAVVVRPQDASDFIKFARDENLEAVEVAVITKEERLRMDWRGKLIVDLSREFLDTNGVTQKANAKITAVKKSDDTRTKCPKELEDISISEAFTKNLTRLNVASQKGLIERFDSSIGAGTVNMPFAGKYQLSPEDCMVAKLPLERGVTDDATVMSYGFIPSHSRFSPFHGSAFAVVESLSKLLSSGANPLTARLTFQEYFERLHDKPERWGKPAAALLGAFIAQKELSVPSIGGKDSMSGSFNELDVPPTLVSFALAMTKASKTLSSALKSTKSSILLLDIAVDEATHLPDFAKLRELYTKLHSLISSGNVLSCSVIKEGGLAAALAKMSFGNKIGMCVESLDKDILFAPLSGSVVIETEDIDAFKGLDYILAAKTNDEQHITLDNQKLSIDELIAAWSSKLEGVFPTKSSCPKASFELESYTQKSTLSPAVKIAKPRVFIPVFPGTNCEYDSVRAFETAGANAEILIVNNLTPNDTMDTMKRIAAMISQSQIVMFPGGFSGGDEPDGSGKFIATAFRNEWVKEAVDNLLNNRNGLMLGICNGFQALIKLGLVPNGQITPIDQNAPTLTFNTIGRHASRMVYTKVQSVKSPWLSLSSCGDIHAVPISHGEGRFAANEQTVKELSKNGQIAFTYCDFDGNDAADFNFNPNGSVFAIEGITSPDGRILGKMAHSERKGIDLYKNVPGEKDQKIFESGVKYFK